MNDCQNVEIREMLPELIHGALPESERARVQEHLDGCADCSAELAIIRAVHASAAAPAVDVARIVASIPPYRRKSRGMRRVYMELAAACLIGAVGISALAIHNSSVSDPGAQRSTVVSVIKNDAGLALVNTSDLSDAGLAQLTQDLDGLQAMPTVDPESVTPVVLEDLAGPGTSGDSA